MDDPGIRIQMATKHPVPAPPTAMPELPPGWANTAKITMDLSELGNILKETDPLVGTGPRG
jgi:hypothetical protein